MAPRLPFLLAMVREQAMGAAGGPWKVRGWDARSWRAPLPRGTARGEARPAGELRVVILYVASVMVGSAAVLALMARGW
jgi:hypothetical protein